MAEKKAGAETVFSKGRRCKAKVARSPSPFLSGSLTKIDASAMDSGIRVIFLSLNGES